MTSAVLALVFGGAGAWAYERFLAQPRVEKPPAGSTSPGPDAEIQKHLARLDDRINGLSDQYKDVQTRLESIPKPSPAPDLAPLEQKVARVDGLSQQVDAIGKKLDPLPGQLAQSEQKLTGLDARLDELRNEMSAAGNRLPARPSRDGAASRATAPLPGDRAEAAPSSSEKGESPGSAYESGVSRFRDKRYREAYDVFRRLLQSQPDDARIWY
jgi:TolA-binding protein